MIPPKEELSIDTKDNLYLRKLSPAVVKFIHDNFPDAKWKFESITSGSAWDIEDGDYLIQIIHLEYHNFKRVALWRYTSSSHQKVWRFDEEEFDDPLFIRKLKLLSFW
jgi:hypothetical protein